MSEGLGDTAALFLAGILAFAGVRKWREPAETEASFRAFGLARPALLARVVPVTEVATAVGLAAAPRSVAFVALALLAAFTTVLVRGLRAGVTVGCRCFGSSGQTAVSSLDVLRNLLFCGLAFGAALLSEPGFARPSLPAAIFLGGGAGAATGLFSLVRARRAPRPAVPTFYRTNPAHETIPSHETNPTEGRS